MQLPEIAVIYNVGPRLLHPGRWLECTTRRGPLTTGPYFLCELPHTAQGALSSAPGAYKGRFASTDAAQARTLKTQGMGHTAENGPTVSAQACGLGAEASYRRRSMAPIDPARAASGPRSAIPPASPCSGSGARFGIDEPQAARADGDPPQEQIRCLPRATA
jgi:hypothetical protein